MSAHINSDEFKLDLASPASLVWSSAIGDDRFDVAAAVEIADQLEKRRHGDPAKGILIATALSIPLWTIIGFGIAAVI